MSVVRLVAPMKGWAAPLDEVPDPVFAERMMGDGVAIDPLEGVLRAPADATVIAVAPTGHSVTLALANGAELLIHIGIETVALGGEGFVARVADGARVAAGEVLIEFDPDRVAAGAKSLITPIVVANEGFELTLFACGRAVEAGEPLLEIRRVATPEPAPAAEGGDTATCEIVIPMANGVHARPAARIVAALKPFAAEVGFTARERTANARSTVALLGLGLRHGDSVLIAGHGADARAAVATIAALIEGGMGEAGEPPPRRVSAPSRSARPLLAGVCASPGLAVGPVVQFRAVDAEVPEQGGGVSHESTALDDALAGVAAAIAGQADGAGIAAAHLALLDDPELIGATRTEIAAGRSAAFAWRAATRAHADAIRATGDALLIERVADLVDIERQVIARLLGEAPQSPPPIPEGAILIADELLPSQFLALDIAKLAGLCTASGGPTSHVAILAASAGVPMLVAAGPAILAIGDGKRVILDADSGSIDSDPDPARLAGVADAVAAARARRAAESAAARDPCVMADGTRIEIFANLASAAEAEHAVAAGAEGCGLLRTEFLFLDRVDPPSEEEQRGAYAAVAAALDGRPLIVRTLDIGGDKPVAYLPFPPEDNPALGARGIRLSLARPDLLVTQLRAILRGVPASQCRIMVPMIVDRDELRAVRALLDQAARDLGVSPVPLGVMIETPAAALLAASLAAEADFLSVGTNDLTQYALAADRGNPALAAKVDALHPAVLRLIAQAGEGARAHGRQLAVCGGAASDPLAVPILIGLGATELSAAPAMIPTLKAGVRRLRRDACRALAERALAAHSADEVRTMAKEAM